MSKLYVDEAPSAQGELLFRKVDTLPEKLSSMKTENSNFVVGHSETGHHHVIKEQEGVAVYTNDNNPFELYLVVNNPKEEVELKHLRSHDTHKSYFFKDGVYHIRRQWEDDGEGLVPALD